MSPLINWRAGTRGLFRVGRSCTKRPGRPPSVPPSQVNASLRPSGESAGYDSTPGLVLTAHRRASGADRPNQSFAVERQSPERGGQCGNRQRRP